MLHAAQHWHSPIPSKSGLLTTLGYKIGKQPAVYCLEGSIAITGALVQWLRDNLNFFEKSTELRISLQKLMMLVVFTLSGILGIVCAILEVRCTRCDRRHDRYVTSTTSHAPP